LSRPRLLVTRKLPNAVEARLARDYDAETNPIDTILKPDDLVAARKARMGFW